MEFIVKKSKLYYLESQMAKSCIIFPFLPLADGNCIVRLLDSGMQEMVPQKALRPLDARFQALPPQAKLCHLDAASNLAPHGVERLEELLAHQTFRAVVRMGAGDILTCSDIPLVLFPSKDRDETTSCEFLVS